MTIQNVAIEAGVSRTLIGMKGCRYEALADEIRAYANSHPRAQPSTALIEQLRAELRRVKRQLELSDTYNAELLLELSALRKNRDGNYPEDDVVTNFRRDRRHGPTSRADPKR